MTAMSAATPAILFDLDDTLFDHSGCTRDALGVLRECYPGLQVLAPDVMAREYHRLLEDLHLRVLAGELGIDEARVRRFERLFARAGITVAADTAHEAATVYRTSYLAAWREVDGAKDLLAALKEIGATGVVTNNRATEQRRKLTCCGFDALLDTVVIAEETGRAKPDPRIFEIALERLGCRAEETVMIGNAWDTDILGARAARIRPVWLSPSGAPSTDETVAEIRSLRPTELVVSVVVEELQARPSESRGPSSKPRTPNPESERCAST